MDEKNEKIEVDFDLLCPNIAWTDRPEDVNTLVKNITEMFNERVESNNLSGAAVTFVLHKLLEIYIETMFRHFQDDDSKSSIYVMTAQIMNANMDMYEKIRAKMPSSMLRLLEEPTQGAV
jgi:hypothetical protein